MLRSIAVVLLVLAVSSCVGMVSDYSTVANAFGEEVSRNTITQLQRKHDTEAMAYAAAYCGQPRIGAVERRYRDPVDLMRRLEMCETERMIGFGP